MICGSQAWYFNHLAMMILNQIDWYRYKQFDDRNIKIVILWCSILKDIFILAWFSEVPQRFEIDWLIAVLEYSANDWLDQKVVRTIIYWKNGVLHVLFWKK